MNNSKKFLLAVSGGPDSMYMLNKYRNKAIEVAHVNYNYRGNDSIKDEALVRNFCNSRKIPFHVLVLNHEKELSLSKIKNKQYRARQIRYDFFFNIMKENNLETLLVAHNKDDFLETAIMQYKKSPNDRLFYGIKKKTMINNFLIERPLLKYWKNDILEKCNKKNIPYRVDQSNFEPVYQRNRIRIVLKNKSLLEKENLIKSYENINLQRKSLDKEVEFSFSLWKDENFSIKVFKEFDDKLKNHLVYQWIIEQNIYINLSKGKIINIVNFIQSKKGNNNNYKLSDKYYILKKNKEIKIERY